jgi:dihydroorotate dehydrogenase
MTRLKISVGSLHLKNPVICGSGEYTMTAAGIRSAIRAGAGLVVAKSTNESDAAKRQLDGTDYMLLDSNWHRLPWDFNPPADAQLFGRSGLVQSDFEPWLEKLAGLDKEAREHDSYVVPSLILSDLERCADFATQVEQAGFRALEVNIGAPHGDEASKGAIVLERSADRVQSITGRLRTATALPLWIKLTGQSEDVPSLAEAAKHGGADAVILMGRFMGFVADLETQRPLLGTNAAIGGAWALALTSRWLVLTRKQIGRDFPLIATNGARNGLDVARFLLAGASAVEMTSAVFTQGARVLAESIAELDDYVATCGISATDLVGKAADAVQSYGEQPGRPEYWRDFLPPDARAENN